MKIIFFLLVLFLIGCLLHGIAAGVQTIFRGATKLTGEIPAKASMPPSRAQSPLNELQQLYQLYQEGALTREEFAQFKQYIFTALAPANKTTKESR